QDLFAFPPGNSQSLISTAAAHIPGGVYGIVIQEPYAFVASGDQGGVLDVWNSDLSSKVNSVSLGSKPAALACDGQDFYALLPDIGGFIRITYPSL
ncbi:MAG: hypothetical protein JWO73_860, partial [Candidatus Taylorbacteria bacterium]|nr:hypothetical protein [Candidatus Taylorbacteria bacterium]